MKYIYTLKRVNSASEYVEAVKNGYVLIKNNDELNEQIFNELEKHKDESDDLLFSYASKLTDFVDSINEPQKRFEIMESLAKKDHVRGYHGIGMCYFYNFYVEKNIDEAIKYFTIAAERGYAPSQERLGQIYSNKKKYPDLYNVNEAIKWLSLAVDQGYAPAELKLGIIYRTEKDAGIDYEKSLNLITKAAEQGYVAALVELGYMYHRGDSVKQDYNAALHWFMIAAEHDEVVAYNNIGYMYEQGQGVSKDINQAIYWYEKAAKHNSVFALAKLGFIYLRGAGVPKDYEKAFEYLSKAAELNDPSSQINLAIMYYNGYGVQRDYEKAFYWINKAVNNEKNKNPLAYSLLAFLYYKGYGTNRDLEKAIYWYEKAAENNNGYGEFALANFYYIGEGVNQDINKAVEYFTKSAEHGYVKAQASLGMIYLYGKGDAISPNYEKAFYWLSKASESGYPNAQYSLALMYYNGYYVEKSNEKAFELALKAADQKYALAQYFVGTCYSRGQGVERDFKKAEYWLLQAGKNGYAKAYYFLGRLYYMLNGIAIDYDKALKYLTLANENGYACREQIEEVEAFIQKRNRENLRVPEDIDIFISWNHNNLDFKEELKKELEDNGIRVWESDSKSGGNLDASVNYAISHCKGYIIILSKEAIESNYMPTEVDMIFNRIKKDNLSDTMIKVFLLDDVINDINKLDKDHPYKRLSSLAANFSKSVVGVTDFAKRSIVEYQVHEYQKKLRDAFDVFPISLSNVLVEDETVDQSISPYIKYEDGYINRPLLDASNNKYDVDDILKLNNPLIIYGDGGSGKSLYLKNMIRRNKNDKKIFFYLPCSETKNYILEKKNIDMYELISHMCFEALKIEHISPNNVKEIFNNEKREVYIVIDAIDESDTLKDKIISLFKGLNNRIHLIFSSRNKNDSNLISSILEKEVLLFTLKELDEEGIMEMFDSIYKRNQIGKKTSSNFKKENELKDGELSDGELNDDISRDAFENNLSLIVSDIKKSPLLISNLIYIYFATKRLPSHKYEILNESNRIMIEALEKRSGLMEDQELILQDTKFKDLNELLENISFVLAINFAKDNDIVTIIKMLLNKKKMMDLSNVKEEERETVLEEKANEIYNYLRSRRIVVANSISHPIYRDFFAANYIYKKIYDLEYVNDEFEYCLGFNPDGLDQLHKFLDKYLSSDNNPWVEIALDFIYKLDYETYKVMKRINRSDSSFETFDESLKAIMDKERGISKTAYDILLNLISKYTNNNSITFLNFSKEIKEYMKR